MSFESIWFRAEIAWSRWIDRNKQKISPPNLAFSVDLRIRLFCGNPEFHIKNRSIFLEIPRHLFDLGIMESVRKNFINFRKSHHCTSFALLFSTGLSAIVVYTSALHYECNSSNGSNVLQRIAIESDDVRLHAGRN